MVTLTDRRSSLLVEPIALHADVRVMRCKRPFGIEAAVALPGTQRAAMMLPTQDADFSD